MACRRQPPRAFSWGDFEYGAEVGWRAERGDSDQVSVGIANKLSERLPAVILVQEIVEHRFRPGGFAGHGRGKLVHSAATDGPIDAIGAVAGASRHGRSIEIAGCVSDHAPCRPHSVR